MSYIHFKYNKDRLNNNFPLPKGNKMLNSFWKLMPVFIVEFLARKYCMKTKILGTTYVQPFKDVLVVFDKKRS